MRLQLSKGLLTANLSNDPPLDETLREVAERADGSPAPNVLLDFGGVEHMNSSHLAQIMKLHKALEPSGRTLVLCGMNERVRSVFDLSNLSRVLHIEDDVDAARESLSSDRDEG